MSDERGTAGADRHRRHGDRFAQAARCAEEDRDLHGLYRACGDDHDAVAQGAGADRERTGAGLSGNEAGARPRADIESILFEDGLVLVDPRDARIAALGPVARFVWQGLADGLGAGLLVPAIADAFDRPVVDVAADIDTAIDAWRQAGLLDGCDGPPRAGPPRTGPDVPAPTGGAAASFTFAIGTVVVGIDCDHAGVRDRMRALFRSHASDSPASLRLSLHARGAGGFRLCQDGRAPQDLDEDGEALGALFQRVLEHLNPCVDWLAMVHGGASALGDRAVLLPAAAGSGKSTLCAWLAARGFTPLGDDLIALAAPDGKVVPWPVPITLKQGSWAPLAGIWPDLAALPVESVLDRAVRFLPTGDDAWTAAPAPVAAIVFPRFKAGAPAALTALAPFAALERLLSDRVWLGHPPSRDGVAAFLDWLRPLPCYALDYGELAAAEALIRPLLAGRCRS